MADDGGIWIKASASAGATATAFVKTASGWEEVSGGSSAVAGAPILMDQHGAEIIRFQPPSDTGGEAVISYIAYSTPTADLKVDYSDIDTIGYGEVYFLDADESEKYVVSVQAVTASGAGPAANTSSFSPIIPYNAATGGVTAVVDDYWNDGSGEKWRYHKFTSANNGQPSGKFNVTKSRLPFRLFLIGGGGRGGQGNGINGGGGGAGGAAQLSNDYPFEVKEYTVFASEGRTASYISGTSPTLSAMGGGAGGAAGVSGTNPGGGGGSPSSAAGLANTSSGLGPTKGGVGTSTAGGGGGGYLAPSATFPYNGGSGMLSDIMGSANETRFGGGGGGGGQSTRGNGGSFVGGNGGSSTASAQVGQADTGSGGGGTFQNVLGADGGSGVCYIAYRIGTTTRHEMLELERQRELTEAAYQRGFTEGSHETHEAYAAMSEPEE